MDDRIKFITDIDTLVKLRFDYISTEIDLSAADKAKLEPKLREYFKEYVPEEKFTAYAMEIDGEIVSAAFLIIDEKPPGLNNLNGRYGTIMNVFTYPEHRGKGYANSVISNLIVDADNIFVSVLDLYSTKAGKRLYEKLGFKEVEYSAMRYYTNK
ncbi:GNAT family N-acetyltransferase [Petrimonas sulfuriphila]|jgi:ribosomal protein S18 acetylase RimI-like enzyme|uniref:GNAT family N-acetyltransferase n=1 Tax=Petrimonas TaxID=307628 RepID=UPI00132253CE|nr:MAG: GNAT family N-acetyltransferase [Paludibacter sp.]MEA4996611.1 GNAT family N-acetyltransferase [Petrimonas sp.]MEA5070499.1 GNAT family N-acetyltransferase [Petrimonas sp.]MEA5081160.1 GNAT family N-acetyltransferase [Dysgonamonadaceae bacterium]